MSKPVTRIVLLALIAIAILVGVFATVGAASLSAGGSRGRAVLTAGLLPDASHPRSVAPIQQVYTPLTEKGSGHHCDDDVSASDY